MVILLLSQIREFLCQNKFLELKEILAKAHHIDIAEKFEDLTDAEKLIIFRFLDKSKSVKLLENLPFKTQYFLLKNLNNDEISEILNDLSCQKIANIFRKLPKKDEDRIFSLLKNEKVEEIKKLFLYPEGTAGSLMQTENLDLERQKSCEIQVDENSSEYEVVNLFLKYQLMSLTVVNQDGKLIGVILVEDILKVVDENQKKEIYAIGKMDIEDGEDVKYRNSTSFELLKRRAGWCILLLIFDFLTVSILKNYESAIIRVVAVSFFLPMILNAGGNAGWQVSVAISRALKRGEISCASFFSVIRKEIIAALFLGLIVGAVAFVRGYLLNFDLLMALFVGISVVAIVFMSAMTGLFLPLISKKIGFDSSVLAAPLIISIVNILGLLIYFNIAIRFLPALKGVF